MHTTYKIGVISLAPSTDLVVLRVIGSKNSVSHTQRFKLRTAGLQILQLEKDCLGWKIYEIYSFLLLSRVRFAVFAIDKCSWPKSSGIKQVGIWDTAVSIQCHSATSSSLFNVIEWMANKRSKPVLAQKSISILRPVFCFRGEQKHLLSISDKPLVSGSLWNFFFPTDLWLGTAVAREVACEWLGAS